MKKINLLVLTQYYPIEADEKNPLQLPIELSHLALQKHIRIILGIKEKTNYIIPNVKIISLEEIYKFKILDFFKIIKNLLYIIVNVLRFYSFLLLKQSNLLYIIDGIKYNLAIEEIIRLYDINIVHSHWFGPNCTAGYWAVKNYDIPLIISARGNDIYYNKKLHYGMRVNRLKDLLITFIAEKAKYITVASNDMYNLACEIISDTNKIILIPNGIDINIFNPSRKNEEIANKLRGNHDFLLLNIGGCIYIKNQIVLIHAVDIMIKRKINVRLVIIGKGALKEQLLNEINKLKLENHFLMIDGVNYYELPYYYTSADCFVFSSLQEGFGNVLLEAISCGLPIVSSPVGIAKDFLIDGQTVLFVNPNDSSDIAQKCEKIIYDKALKNYMIQKGLSLVNTTFSIYNKINHWIYYYENSISEKMN